MSEGEGSGQRGRFSYANVMSTLAVFLVIAGGSAQALSGSNTIFSDDIVNGQVKNPDLLRDSVTTGKIRAGQVASSDLGANAVTSDKVANDSLTGDDVSNKSLIGADIDESSLAEVPRATLGGFGRSAGGPATCDPDSLTLITCASDSLNLPAETRILVMGQIRAYSKVPDGVVEGTCELGSDVVDMPSTFTWARVGGKGQPSENLTLVGITPRVGPGPVDLRINCNQSVPDIGYGPSEIAAVAISPG